MSRSPKTTASALQRTGADRLMTTMRAYRQGGRRARTIRRAIALVLLLTAGVMALGTSSPRDRAGTAVTAVTRDLAAGRTLQPDDLRTTRIIDPPDGALAAGAPPVGEVLAGAVRRGEVLTDARIVGSEGPSPGPGRTAVPVRPQDPATATLLHVGARVSVIGVDAGGAAHALADDAIVLAIRTGAEDGASDASPVVILAVPDRDAASVAATAITGTIGLIFA